MGAMNMGSGMAMDLNDIDYDAFLANDARSPIGGHRTNGRAGPAAVINAASSTQFWIDLGCAHRTVVARRPSGSTVRGSRLPLAMRSARRAD